MGKQRSGIARKWLMRWRLVGCNLWMIHPTQLPEEDSQGERRVKGFYDFPDPSRHWQQNPKKDLRWPRTMASGHGSTSWPSSSLFSLTRLLGGSGDGQGLCLSWNQCRWGRLWQLLRRPRRMVTTSTRRSKSWDHSPSDVASSALTLLSIWMMPETKFLNTRPKPWIPRTPSSRRTLSAINWLRHLMVSLRNEIDSVEPILQTRTNWTRCLWSSCSWKPVEDLHQLQLSRFRSTPWTVSWTSPVRSSVPKDWCPGGGETSSPTFSRGDALPGVRWRRAWTRGQ